MLNEEDSRPIIKKTLELGINFFDTANVYSIGASNEILGRALKDFAKRDEIIIATKVHGKMRENPNGGVLSRKAILSEIDNSLRRLCMDYVDLYQIHGWIRFISPQVHLNLIYDEEEREMLPLSREERIGVIPYSPLTSGRLTRDGSSESTLRSETDQIAKNKADSNRSIPISLTSGSIEQPKHSLLPRIKP